MIFITKKAQLILLNNLREDILRGNFPPNYDADYRYYNPNSGHNCYSYALQLKQSIQQLIRINKKLTYPYAPGTISNTRGTSYTRENLIESFLEDCYLLGIRCIPTTTSSESFDSEYKVAVFLNEKKSERTGRKDCHFIRQNDDLSWSEKKGVYGAVHHVDKVDDYEGHELLKVYRISRIGDKREY